MVQHGLGQWEEEDQEEMEAGGSTDLWFSSLSAGVKVFFCFRCSMTAFCFITTWNIRYAFISGWGHLHTHTIFK